MSGNGDSVSQPLSLPHTKIVWADDTGIPGTKYCCVCSYTVRVKPSVPCSQANCPNVACKGCCEDNTFCCSTTSQLRSVGGITRPVIREPRKPRQLRNISHTSTYTDETDRPALSAPHTPAQTHPAARPSLR
ncbi:hypothetical protein E2C01_091015 [Portunus trituberculatus]|uniref:Uncharacterized protein n=1 Tax=Portunus trituberculatus TaxID=210409 RepID=A0A5B7JLX0_PORTR|nr:hypothetical protein [Portunus trituberculatus]